MGHHHHDDHHHHHHHPITNKNKTLFIWAASLTLFFALLEIVYGFISGSLMIIGDGVHMSSDAISLILSLIATVLAVKASNNNRTFGYKRFEPIAAFINGLTLIIIPLYIIYEAIMRVIHPVEIMAKEMMIVGLIGLTINGVVGYILSKGESNLNMRSAMLHVIADMITSLSAVIVAISILLFDTIWLDPVGSIITSIIIIRGGLAITKESFNILMEGTPDGYSVEAIKTFTEALPAVAEVKEIKVWCINEEEVYCILRFLPSDHWENEKSFKEKIHEQFHLEIDHIFLDKVEKA